MEIKGNHNNQEQKDKNNSLSLSDFPKINNNNNHEITFSIGLSYISHLPSTKNDEENNSLVKILNNNNK